eukprot:6194577-Ditylum_brightwellii.AAC.1
MERHSCLEKDVTARGYWQAGNQMFLYSLNAFFGVIRACRILDAIRELYFWHRNNSLLKSPAGLASTPNCLTGLLTSLRCTCCKTGELPMDMD